MNKRGAVNFFYNLFRIKPQGNCYSKLSSINVSDIMIKDVLCCQRTERLIEAAHLMIGAHASCLVVMDGDKPSGIITERDFVRKLPMEKDHSSEVIVDDFMTKKLFSVNHHTSLIEAQKIMREHSFRKLIVIENEDLKGIITQTDLCWAVEDIKTDYHNTPIVRNIMSRKVLTVAEDDKFLKVKKLMSAKDIGSVLIVVNGELKGMFTEFDMVSEFFLNPNRLRNSYMNDLMTAPVVCINPDFNVFEINSIMLKHNFRRLPVLENNKLVGIITQTDVARAMYEFIEKNKDAVCETKSNQNKEPVYCIKKAGNIILYEKKREEPQKTASKKLAGSENERFLKKGKEAIKEQPAQQPVKPQEQTKPKSVSRPKNKPKPKPKEKPRPAKKKAAKPRKKK